MFPASSKGGGQCMAFPDVCKVPAPPAPFVPTPFPNVAQCADATGTSTKVKILNKAVIHKGSEIPRSSGDEPGALGGMISGVNMSKAKWKSFSSKVRIEGNDCVKHMSTTGQNGANANAFGAQTVPSQTTVILLG